MKLPRDPHFILSELCRKENIDILYILLFQRDKPFHMPYLTGMPRVHCRISSVTNPELSGWIIVYSRLQTPGSYHKFGLELTSTLTLAAPDIYPDEITVSRDGILKVAKRVFIDPNDFIGNNRPPHFHPLDDSTAITAPVSVTDPTAITAIILYSDDNQEAICDANTPNQWEDFLRSTISKLTASRQFAQKTYDKYCDQRILRERVTKPLQLGDLVYLSIPLQNVSRKKGNNKAKSPKFMFRWAGPMRIAGISEDGTRLTLVETFRDGSIMSRLANLSRVRPFTPRLPKDSPKFATNRSHDDFEEEIRQWGQKRVVQRAPKHKFLPRTPIGLLRWREAEMLDDNDLESETFIEHILETRYYAEEDFFKYLVKFLRYGNHYNLWHSEDDLPKETVAVFWEAIRDKYPQLYTQHNQWLSRGKRQPRPSKKQKPTPPVHNTNDANKGRDDEDHDYDNFEIVLTSITKPTPLSTLSLFTNPRIRKSLNLFH